MLHHFLIPQGVIDWQCLKIILNRIDLPILLGHLAQMQLPQYNFIQILPITYKKALTNGQSLRVEVIELLEFVLRVGLENEWVFAD